MGKEDLLTLDDEVEELSDRVDDLEDDVETHKSIVNSLIEYLVRTEAKVNALATLLADMNVIDPRTLEELAEEEEEELLKQFD